MSSPAVGAIGAQPLAAGPTIAGLGGASAALSHDSHALANPASVTGARKLGVSFAASRSFGLNELDHVSSAVVFRARFLTWATVVEAFGFDDFRQITAHLVVAHAANSGQPRVGVRTTARHIGIKGYGSQRLFAASAGVQYPVSSTVDAGLMIENAITTGGSSSNLQLRMVVGVRILLPGHLTLFADLDREDGFAPAVLAGIEKTILRQLALRTGFSTVPSTFAFGLGIRHRGVETSVASQRHQPLGWSRSVGIAIGG